MIRKKSKDALPQKSFLNRPFWKFFSKIGDFFVLNILWLVTSLPVITIGASTTALFYVFLKTRSGESGTLWGMYKKSFRENFKQATFVWLLYLFVALDVFLVGLSVYAKGGFTLEDLRLDGKYGVALLIIGLIYTAIMIYSAALMAMFRQTTVQCILSAVGLAFHRIFSTLLFFVILGLIGFTTYYYFPPLIFIAVPLAVWLISLRMYRIFLKQISRVEQRAEKQALSIEDDSQGEKPEAGE